MQRFLVLLYLSCGFGFGQITVIDSLTTYPASYAAISFGNGNGLFADDQGQFVFTKKLYPDIDSLYISALGYKDLNLATKDLKQQLLLQPQTDVLDEVLIGVSLGRKFKTEKYKAYLDDDYYNCWLPTIESEIAVFIEHPDDKDRQLSSVIFPIALESKDWSQRKRSNADKKKFSTLFNVKFYTNNGGLPGKPLTYETVVFRATQKNGDSYTLDVTDYTLNMPKDGMFVSLQVMGYTDKAGRLLPNKKYKEIKRGSDVVKIPTNFRPLLPFTNEIDPHQTYVKRVFINNNQWVPFKKGSGFKSTLLDKGYYNYGIGYTAKVYKDE
ncbi:MAG: hypothetical protein HKP45_02525 [Winogradskyella sp.]|nr:hypothetical protein [Winogradskyella sp.]NNK39510.1 hypothetical protein [Winogradskyella sp.]